MNNLNKYRVYEVISIDGKEIKEHGNFNSLKEAKRYCAQLYRENKDIALIINYKLNDRIVEEYYRALAN